MLFMSVKLQFTTCGQRTEANFAATLTSLTGSCCFMAHFSFWSPGKVGCLSFVTGMCDNLVSTVWSGWKKSLIFTPFICHVVSLPFSSPRMRVQVLLTMKKKKVRSMNEYEFGHESSNDLWQGRWKGRRARSYNKHLRLVSTSLVFLAKLIVFIGLRVSRQSILCSFFTW